MSRKNIPDWTDMPECTPLASLCWRDIYLCACDDLERAPTRQEVIDIMDVAIGTTSDVIGETFSEVLLDVVQSIIPGVLQSKGYDIDTMSDEELRSKKWCHECLEVQETYWELAICDKNTQGLSSISRDHGNEQDCIIKCSDAWCNPELQTVETQLITKEYVNTHNVDEKCTKCHHMLESQYSNRTTKQERS